MKKIMFLCLCICICISYLSWSFRPINREIVPLIHFMAIDCSVEPNFIEATQLNILSHIEFRWKLFQVLWTNKNSSDTCESIENVINMKTKQTYLLERCYGRCAHTLKPVLHAEMFGNLVWQMETFHWFPSRINRAL